MSGKSTVPNAWDDDWETLADKPEPSNEEEPGKEPEKLTKAERKAQHAEANRQLWQSAESLETPIFLQAGKDVPLASDYKPAMKVLSRKPPAAQAGGASRAMGALSLDDDDSEEEERRRAAGSFAERQAKAQKEREEKQRKYQEARDRIFSSPAPPSDAPQARSSSKAGQTTTTSSASRNPPSRGKGRGKGPADSQASSSSDQSPARGQSQQRQLFDPNHAPKPSLPLARRDASGGSRPETPAESQHVRSPKGPDGSGRGGFGFAQRGSRAGS